VTSDIGFGDASDIGFGAILYSTQGEGSARVRPIAYFLRKWRNNTERIAHPCRKELSALKQSISHFHPYLYGNPFHVITDNMGVFHMVQNAAQGKMPKDTIHARYLNQILMHQIKSVTHKSMKQVFTSDSLS